MKSYSELSKLIDEWVLSDRDRRIVKRRMLDGIHFEQLAEEYDLSVRQIKTICYRAMAEIAKH